MEKNIMSTRACYRFIDPDTSEVATVYKHHDGYPEGAVCWITKALDYAWRLPRFEADEFAAAFVAANKPSAGDKHREYLEKGQKENNSKTKAALLSLAADWGPSGRYAAMHGGGVRIVNRPGMDAFKGYASDIEYLYDVTLKTNELHVSVYATHECEGEWAIEPLFAGTLAEMQAKYGLQYLEVA
jgi:hypothetical protein